jgi:cytochrome d ubiquinol oxidase subunit II
MLFIWFWLVAAMITAYVVLDGFDLGAGVLHLIIAKTDQERQTVIRTISPVWDGNEVWLLAGGGTLFFAFPLLYASSFSGFYLPLMIVLWLLILRGIGIELRMHLNGTVWRGFFDGCFAISSLLLTIFYGAALGNVVRGVPLNKEGYFFLPLWTNWRPGAEPGILDWYTVIAGVVALVALTMHGAHYVAVKTSGDLNLRARRVAAVLWPVLVLVTLLSLWATLTIRPEVLKNYRNVPALFVIPVAVALSLMAMFLHRRRGGARRSADALLAGRPLRRHALGPLGPVPRARHRERRKTAGIDGIDGDVVLCRHLVHALHVELEVLAGEEAIAVFVGIVFAGARIPTIRIAEPR